MIYIKSNSFDWLILLTFPNDDLNIFIYYLELLMQLHPKRIYPMKKSGEFIEICIIVR